MTASKRICSNDLQVMPRCKLLGLGNNLISPYGYDVCLVSCKAHVESGQVPCLILMLLYRILHASQKRDVRKSSNSQATARCYV